MTEPEEIEWAHLAEGDQLKSVKNGKFYLVRRVQTIAGGKVKIELDIGSFHGSSKSIERPTVAEPKAWVIRGKTGEAVQMFVQVFTSG